MPSDFVTVKELREALEALPDDLPVIISTHYDNDIGHASQITMERSGINHQELDYWIPNPDVNDPQNPPDVADAVIITAWSPSS